MTPADALAVVTAMESAAPEVRNLADDLQVQLIAEICRIPITKDHAMKVVYGHATSRKSGQRFATVADLIEAMKRAVRVSTNEQQRPATPKPERKEPRGFCGYPSPYHYYAADPEGMERECPEWFEPVLRRDGQMRAHVESKYFLARVQVIRDRTRQPVALLPSRV